MRITRRSTLAGIAGLSLCASVPMAAAAPSLREQVWARELAFARSMAERDRHAFANFLSEEAVFFAGTQVLTGKAQVVEAWSTYFKDPAPPFSWQPDQVEVLESGTLAISTGPVRDAAGTVIARFTSIWRLEGGGVWRVIFDKGSPPSPGPQ